MLSIKPTVRNHIVYEHIKGSLQEQIDLVKEYKVYLELRELLEGHDDHQASLPVLYTRPTLPQASARRGDRESLTVNL